MPEFIGGEQEMLKWIYTKITYPILAKENGIQGKVYVGFVIDTIGNITNVEVKRGASPILDAEVVRVIKAMPKWKPGKHKGKAVPVYYTLPINFSLPR